MLTMDILDILFDWTAKLLQFLAKRIRGSRLVLQSLGLAIIFEDAAKGSIDQRIAKIGEARSALVEGIRAIDDLKAAADYNKREADQAVAQIALLERDKATLDEEIENMKTVIESDVEAFRRIAGVPSPSDVRRERVVGFITGLVASALASGLVFAILSGIAFFKNHRWESLRASSTYFPGEPVSYQSDAVQGQANWRR